MNTVGPEAPTPAGAEEVDDGLGWGEAARPAAEEAGEPLLERAEVAALLGGARDGAKPAVLALVARDAVAHERLPMLEAVVDRLRSAMVESLRELTGGPVDLATDELGARRFGTYLGSLERPVPIAVFRAVEWQGRGLLTVERALAFALVDILLGGRRAGTALAGGARALTTIETTLVERFVRIVLADLARAFAPVGAVRFELERIETDPRFAAITRPGNGCVLLRLSVLLDGRGGGLALLLPYATLEPVRARLAETFPGERFGRDPIWERHFEDRILGAAVELEAVLDGGSVGLRQLLDLRPGAVLPLDVRPDDPVVLRCGGVPLLLGKLGRVGDRVSVRIEERIVRERDG